MSGPEYSDHRTQPHDPSRDGTRCVYGYFTREEVQP